MTKPAFNTDKFEELVKKSKKDKKKKSVLMVVLSVILSLVLVFAIFFGVFMVNDLHFYENAKYLETKVRFMSPNLQTTYSGQANTGLYSGRNTTAVQKDVNGYLLDWGYMTGEYSIASQLGEVNDYNLGGQSYPEGHEMQFFNPNTTYKAITQEIQEKALAEENYTVKKGKGGSKRTIFHGNLYQEVTLPNDLADVVKTSNRVIEVGISFDKPYTYKEVQKMLPDNLNQAWYWVSEGVQKTKSIQHLHVEHLDDEIFAPTVTFGYSNVSDFKYGDLRLGEYWKGNKGLEQVFNALQKKYAVKMDKEEQTILSDILANNHLKNKTNMLLNGIVLTGRSENFKQLEGQSWVRAASAGASAEMVPYIKPTK
jgi:hypothetical protein